MTNEDKREVSKRRGAPPPTGLENRMHSGTLCTAKRKNGLPCTNFARLGSRVCRMHGGSAPQVLRAAQVRLVMAADPLIAELLAIGRDKTEPTTIRLTAIRDALNRIPGLGGGRGDVAMEFDASEKRDFSDVTADVVMDLVMDEDDFSIVDAEVIEDDDSPLVPRDPDAAPYVVNRHDRAVFDQVERGRAAEHQRMRSGGMSEAERWKLEAAALAEHQAVPRDRSGRAAYLAALDNGATHEQAEAAARASVEGGDDSGKRRARTSEATMSDGRGQRRKRK